MYEHDLLIFYIRLPAAASSLSEMSAGKNFLQLLNVKRSEGTPAYIQHVRHKFKSTTDRFHGIPVNFNQRNSSLSSTIKAPNFDNDA
jgi:hypothetical protein